VAVAIVAVFIPDFGGNTGTDSTVVAIRVRVASAIGAYAITINVAACNANAVVVFPGEAVYAPTDVCVRNPRSVFKIIAVTACYSKFIAKNASSTIAPTLT
jgi:hypothetical protein